MRVTEQVLRRKVVEDVDIGDCEEYVLELTFDEESQSVEWELSKVEWDDSGGDPEVGPDPSRKWVKVEEIDLAEPYLAHQAFDDPGQYAPVLVEELIRNGHAYWQHCRDGEAIAAEEEAARYRRRL